MPQPKRIPAELRHKIAFLIQNGHGRNELAREFELSAGVVSKIAREHHLLFARSGAAVAATQARQIDQWAQRVDREHELIMEWLALPILEDSNGQPTKRARQLDYAIYNVNRHSLHGTRSPVH